MIDQYALTELVDTVPSIRKMAWSASGKALYTIISAVLVIIFFLGSLLCAGAVDKIAW